MNKSWLVKRRLSGVGVGWVGGGVGGVSWGYILLSLLCNGFGLAGIGVCRVRVTVMAGLVAGLEYRSMRCPFFSSDTSGCIDIYSDAFFFFDIA